MPVCLVRSINKALDLPHHTRRQRHPKAERCVFITMEDEDGLMNVIVKPDVYQTDYEALPNCLLLIVEGTIQKQPGILNVLAEGTLQPASWLSRLCISAPS